MNQLMSKLFGLGGFALMGLGLLRGQTTTINYQSNLMGVNDSSGNPVADHSLVLLIANESGSAGFTLPLAAGSLNIGDLLDGSYQILDRTSVDGGFSTPGAFAGVKEYDPGDFSSLQAGDQLAVVWFTNVTDRDSTLAGGQDYGLYTENDSTWMTPAAGGDSTLIVMDGERANLTSVDSLSAVPEPSTYALMAGGAALLFAFWRRRVTAAA